MIWKSQIFLESFVKKENEVEEFAGMNDSHIIEELELKCNFLENRTKTLMRNINQINKTFKRL